MAYLAVMQTGPYVYDAARKKFVKRNEGGVQDGQVPVDPMAGPLASIGAAKKAPVPKWKAIFWSILGAMFVVWVFLVTVWLDQVKETRRDVLLKSAPMDATRSKNQSLVK